MNRYAAISSDTSGLVESDKLMEDDAFDYALETHPVFIDRVERARAQFRAGKGIRIEDVLEELAREESQPK